MEYNGPLFDEVHVKQKVKEFIASAKNLITVISTGIDDAFAKMFNDNGIEKEIFYPESKAFPNISIIVIDGKKALIVSGQLTAGPQYTFLREMEGERLEQFLLELKELFSIECEFEG